MLDKLIESFLKYEEQRKAQKNPNEFQSVKNLQEKETRISASGGANTEQVAAGAGTGYTGGRQANTPVSTTTLSDFPSIENAMKRFGEIRPSANPLNSIASGIGDAARSVAARLPSSDEPRNQFPTPEAKGENDEGNPAPAADQDERADSNQIIPPRSPAPSIKRTVHDDAEITDKEEQRGGQARAQERYLRWQFRGFADPTPHEGVRMPTSAPASARSTADVGRGYAASPADAGRVGAIVAARSGGEADVPAPGEGSVDAAAASAQKTPTATPANGAGSRSITSTSPTPASSTGRTSATSTHTVASGDNLSTLAQKNNLSVRDIMAANPDITDPNRIRVGQTIRIPRSLAASDKKIYAGGVGARPTNESVEFSEAELAHFKSILEAMPVAPTAEGHGPNPTPKNKAEGGKGRGSLSEKMDPVGEEDDDVNNDGEVKPDDEYLRRRRNAIADNMKKKK